MYQYRNFFFVAVLCCVSLPGCTEREARKLPQTVDNKIDGEAIQNAASDTLDTREFRYYSTGGISSSMRNRSRTVITPNFTNQFSKQKTSREIFYLAGVLTNYLDFTYAAGALQTRIDYNGAGTDGAWQTADDVIANYVNFAPDAATGAKHIHYIAAGVDGAWQTADDVVGSYEADLPDAAGAIIGEASYSAAGADGNWFTGDDIISRLEVRGKTGANDNTWVNYSGPGPDGNWTTLTDNVVAEFVVRTMKAPGKPSKIVMYIGVGADGQLFTSDDVPRSYRTFTYDAQNEVTQSIFYAGGPGPDGIWFTADDAIRLCRQLERDAAGKPYRTIGYRPGPDTSCFTSDDIVRGYHQDEFNAANLVTKSTTYTGIGTDAAWFTADDVIQQEEFFVVP